MSASGGGNRVDVLLDGGRHVPAPLPGPGRGPSDRHPTALLLRARPPGRPPRRGPDGARLVPASGSSSSTTPSAPTSPTPISSPSAPPASRPTSSDRSAGGRSTRPRSGPTPGSWSSTARWATRAASGSTTAGPPGARPDEPGWRDTNARFTGPAVASLQAAFAAGWAETAGSCWRAPPSTRGCKAGDRASFPGPASPTHRRRHPLPPRRGEQHRRATPGPHHRRARNPLHRQRLLRPGPRVPSSC
jgi:hypothetical protein